MSLFIAIKPTAVTLIKTEMKEKKLIIKKSLVKSAYCRVAQGADLTKDGYKTGRNATLFIPEAELQEAEFIAKGNKFIVGKIPENIITFQELEKLFGKDAIFTMTNYSYMPANLLKLSHYNVKGS